MCAGKTNMQYSTGSPGVFLPVQYCTGTVQVHREQWRARPLLYGRRSAITFAATTRQRTVQLQAL